MSSSASQEPSDSIDLRLVVAALAGLLMGLVVGGLAYLQPVSVPAAILAGMSAAGATFAATLRSTRS